MTQPTSRATLKDYAKRQGDHDAHFSSFCFQIESYPIEGFDNKINL